MIARDHQVRFPAVRQAIPFGKYVLLDRISVGGMAEVFKAKSYGVEGFEKIIAIKRILPSMGDDRDFIKMFIDEAKIAGQLAHANICQIFELGRLDGAHFIAMEYIWGKDLLQIQNRLKKLRQPMPVAMACFVIAKVCEGLDYAHRRRDAMGRPLEIVHRDCSPQNILVSYEGEVKIIDFGIAKAASRSSRTMAGVLKGKFGYMSPEQVRGLPLDRRSDLFALGTMLYECLTGERLFAGETDFSTLEKVRNVDIVPPRQVNPDIPEAVEQIILRALARDVDDRYQWCSEMMADLQTFLMGQGAVFTAKSLATTLRQCFAIELERERTQLEGYRKLGRDGLISGVPQAEARIDVVEHFGPAGHADDPTVLGGPSFDADGSPVAAAPAAAAPPRAAHARGDDDHGDFGEEAPTEIFGEIVDVEVLASAAVASPAALMAAAPPAVIVRQPTQPVPVLPPRRTLSHSAAPLASGSGPVPPVTGPVMTPVGANASAPVQRTLLGMAPPVIAQGAYHSGAITSPVGYPATGAAPVASNGYGPPDGGALGQPVFNAPGWPASQPSPGAYGGHGGAGHGGVAHGSAAYGAQGYPDPQPAAPVPTPSNVAAFDPRAGRRPSLIKDIAIGVGIAAVVLGLFAVGKLVFFGDSAGARAAQAAAAGTIVITLTDEQPADVFINGERRGIATNGSFTAQQLDRGDYAIKVARQGLSPCEHQVTLDGGGVATVRCAFGAGGLAAAADRAAAPPPGEALVVDMVVAPLSDAAATAERPVAPSVVQLTGDTPVVPQDSPAPTIKADAAAPTPPTPPTTTVKDLPAKPAAPPSVVVAKAPTTPALAPTPRPPRKPAAVATPTPSATADGYLIAYTKPWAKVVIDGKETGKMTPIAARAKIALPPGKHKVAFIVGRDTFGYTVTIESGKDTKISKDLPVQDPGD